MKIAYVTLKANIPKDELAKAAAILLSVEGITKHLPDIIDAAKPPKKGAKQ